MLGGCQSDPWEARAILYDAAPHYAVKRTGRGANGRRVTLSQHLSVLPRSSHCNLLLYFPRLTAVEEFLQAADAETLDCLLHLIRHQVFIGGFNE